MSSLLLLEPYRSALLAEALDEGLAFLPKDFDVSSAPAIQIGKERRLQNRVRTLALLFEELTIIHYEERGNAEELRRRGFVAASLLPLQDAGVVRFSRPEVDQARVERLKVDVKSLEDWWQADLALLDSYAPVIISQMTERGKLPHPALFDLMRAKRLQQDTEVARHHVPSEYTDFADMLLNDKLQPPYDFVVFSTLNELLSVEVLTRSGNVKVAMAQPRPKFAPQVDAVAADQLYSIVLDQLADRGFSLPIPTSLKEMTRMRSEPRMKEFRVLFSDWLSTLQAPDPEGEKRIRNEIRAAVRKFRVAPQLEHLSDILALVSLPLGFAGPTGGFVSAGLGLVSLGLPKLAKRWAMQTHWLTLCERRTEVA